jgi:hypothetical protein
MDMRREPRRDEGVQRTPEECVVAELDVTFTRVD